MYTRKATPAPTAAAAFFQERRTEFDAAAANRALSAMRRGAVLRLEYRAGKASWSLSGKQVSSSVADLIIASELVAPADSALFDCVPAQSWRYAK